MAPMPDQTKTVFLHVGCRKSGTSALQLGLRRAADRLRELGLEQPLGARGGTMAGLITPVQRALGGEEEVGRVAVAALAEKIRRSEQPRHLITLEALAELPAEATSLIVTGLAEFDTRVIVTARPWPLTIPSEWQQRVKSRFTGGYLEYAAAVRRPDGATGELAQEADDFRRRQDVADVVRRWRAADPELPAHVILVPQSRHTRPGLIDLFCDVIGVAPGELAIPDRMINESLSHEKAEVLRLVNLALGDRLQNRRGNYRYSVRKWIAVATLMRGSSGAKIRLPRELEDWASEETARQVEELRREGCDLLGDPDGFIRPDLPGEDFVPASDAEVAQAAAAALADLAARHARRRRQARKRARTRRARRSQRQGTGAGVSAPASAGARRAVGSLRGRVARLTRGRRFRLPGGGG